MSRAPIWRCSSPGETGVGKELVARQIHDASSRADEALIHVNCAALPVSASRRASCSATWRARSPAPCKDRAGKFEVADGGTLFLDEIGELPLELQPKLLRALQHGEIQRVGSDRVHRVNVRVIAATNRDLEREVRAGPVPRRPVSPPRRVPAPRPAAARAARGHSAARLALRRQRGAADWRGRVRIDAVARARLAESDWPGNVRELENVIARAVLRAAGTASSGLSHRRRW